MVSGIPFMKRLAEEVCAAALKAEAARTPARHPLRPAPEVMALRCERALWYGLKGVPPRPADGGQARAMERGRLARRLVVRDLRRAGYRIQWAGPLECGYIYGLTKKPHLLEVQPVGEGVFRRLKRFGLGAAVDLEIVLHCRLGYARLDRALFVAENSATSELHFERVQFDPDIFSQVKSGLGEVLARADAPPPSAGEDCRSCLFREACLGPKKAF